MSTLLHIHKFTTFILLSTSSNQYESRISRFLSFGQINKQTSFGPKRHFFSALFEKNQNKYHVNFVKKIVKKNVKTCRELITYFTFFLFSVGYQNALGYNANGQYGYTYGGGVGLGPKFAHSNYVNQASLPDYSNNPYVLNPYSSR